MAHLQRVSPQVTICLFHALFTNIHYVTWERSENVWA